MVATGYTDKIISLRFKVESIAPAVCAYILQAKACGYLQPDYYIDY